MATRRRLTAEERDARDARVIAMRRTRASWQAIGTDLGVTPQRAHQIYKKAIAKNPLTAVQIDEHRLEELELYDLATQHLMRMALDNGKLRNGNPVVSPRTKVEAWSAIRAWAERKSKLLGLDAPINHNLTIDMIDREMAALVEEMNTAPEYQIPMDDTDLSDLDVSALSTDNNPDRSGGPRF